MNETTTATTTGRATLTDEIKALPAAYNTLVGEIAEGSWRTRSSIPAWTCGQLAWHLASGLAFVAGQAEGARKGKALNPPSFLLPLAFKASEIRVRLASRRATPESVRADFDGGVARLLAVLDGTSDEQLAQTVTLMGEQRSIAQMFHISKEHFDEHAADIRKGLRQRA